MSSNQTFLPEDYVAQRAERRTNVICVVLFLVVMAVVFGAFLVTNRQWSKIKERQESINIHYQQAALRIEKLNELEQQKEQMLEKAELAAALVERVPRSILLAELINRMPPRLGLLELDLKSERIKAPSKPPTGTKSLKGGPERGLTKEEAGAVVTKVEAPRYLVNVTMLGVAPTDLEVSRYMGELNSYALVRDVTLEYSEEKDIENRTVREFKIRMKLDPDADVRNVEPRVAPRDIPDPMMDDIQFGRSPRASVGPSVQEDHP
jgi:Tfp pilus assembly protein PilN